MSEEQEEAERSGDTAPTAPTERPVLKLTEREIAYWRRYGDDV